MGSSPTCRAIFKERIMFNLEDFKKYGVAIRRDGKRIRFAAHIPEAVRADTHVLRDLQESA